MRSGLKRIRDPCTRSRQRAPAAALLALSLCAMPAAAAHLESQDRLARVTADGDRGCTPETHLICQLLAPPSGPYSETQESAATGFEPFSASLDNWDTTSYGGASASQSATLTDTSIVGQGSISAEAIDYFETGGGVTAWDFADTTARTHLFASLELDRAAAYTFEGTVGGWFAPFWGSLELRVDLIGPQGPIHQIRCPFDPEPAPPCGPYTESHSGTLVPGIYTVEAALETTGFRDELGGPPGTAGDGTFGVAFGLVPVVPGLDGMGLWLLAVALASSGLRARPGRWGHSGEGTLP